MILNTIYVIAWAVSGPALAQQDAVADFDIAGVKLNATPAEVSAALTKSGYRVDSTYEDWSFAQIVAQQAARREGKKVPWTKYGGISALNATGPNRESALVRFWQYPDGSRVSKVSISISEKTMTRIAFTAQLASKYGVPHAIDPDWLTQYWCSSKLKDACGKSSGTSGRQYISQPHLEATFIMGNTVALIAGSEADKALNRDFEAAVDRLAPKKREAAF